MDFHFPEQQKRLREEVRSFLKKEGTPEVVKETESNLGLGPHSWQFMRKVGARGWAMSKTSKLYSLMAPS